MKALRKRLNCESTLKKAEREAREKAEREAREKAAAEKSSGKKKKEGFFSKLMGGLKKTRDTLFGGLFVENGEKIDDEFYEELEEAMIISDMGMATTEKLLGAAPFEAAFRGCSHTHGSKTGHDIPACGLYAAGRRFS